jgi:hypothetical protein
MHAWCPGLPALSAGFTREGHFSGEQHSGVAAAASVPASFLFLVVHLKLGLVSKTLRFARIERPRPDEL